MKVRVSLLMIVLLLMQMVLPGVAPLQTASSEQNNAGNEFFDFNNLTEDSYREEDGHSYVYLNWSLENYQIDEVDRPVEFSTPLKLIDQTGELFDEESIASFKTSEDKIIVSFNDLALNYPNANGTVKLEIELDVPDEVEEVEVEEEVVEEPKKENLEIKTFDTNTYKNLGNIFTFESLKINNEDIADGDIIEIDAGTDAQLGFTWNTEGLGAKAGDTASIQLSDAFVMITTPKEQILVDGIDVGTYHVENGVLKFEFNENIEGDDAQNGYANLGLEFNLAKFRENIKQEIPFNDRDENSITVIAKPNTNHSGITKEGHPNKQHDAREIIWTIDVLNTNDEEITGATLADNIPEGLGTARDFVIHELSVGFDGDLRDGTDVTSTINPTGFPIEFDAIAPFRGYRVQYTTTIENYAAESFTNAATFEYDEEPLTAESTVDGLTRSNPIEKEGSQVGDSDVIQWQIDVNKNGSIISEAIVEDELPDGLTIDPDSIAVVRITQSGDNWTEVAHHETSFEEFPIELGALGQEDAYRIKFETVVDWGKVDSGEYSEKNGFENEATLYDGEDELNTDDATVTIERDPILEKVEMGNVNYENRTITWEVTVNKEKHPLGDVTVTDILPEGLFLVEDDINITGDEETNFSSIMPSIDTTNDGLNDGKTKLTLNLTDVGTETITIVYTTSIDNFESNSFTNTVGMTGEGVGEGGEDREVTIQPNANTYTKSYVGINYNAKTMDWRLNVNPIREDINSGFVITDTFTNDGLILLPKTVKVRLGGTELVLGTDYELAPINNGYQNGFTITFDRVIAGGELVVTYTTSYDPETEVDDEFLIPHSNEDEIRLYRNKAEFNGTTENGHLIEKEAYASHNVREDSWNSGKKEGQLVHFDEEGNKVDGWASGSERKIAWQVYTNYQQQNLGTGVVISDTLAYEGSIDEDSIVVSVYEVSVAGETTITEETLVKDNDYSVAVDGKELTLTFAEGFVVDERYVIEFTTSVPDISADIYTNSATVTADDVDYDYSATVKYNQHNNFLAKGTNQNQAYTGDEIEWKVKVNESLSIIKEAVITDTISAGHVYLNGSLEIYKSQDLESPLLEGTDYTLEVVPVTDEDGEPTGATNLVINMTEDLQDTLVLKYTTVVTETNGQIGNSISLEGTAIDQEFFESNTINARQFSSVGGQWATNRGALRVTKVDSEEEKEPITSNETTFTLWYDLNGEEVQYTQVDEEGEVVPFITKAGVLEIGDLPLRTYYLIEEEAPTGYVLSSDKMVINIDKPYGNNELVYEEEFENTKEKIDVTGTKEWVNGPEEKSTVELQLYRGEDPVGEPETLDGTEETPWTYNWTGLDKTDIDGNVYEYTVDEVSVPENYEKSISEDGRTITNTYVIPTTEITATKEWTGGPEEKPTVWFKLYRQIDDAEKEPIPETDIKILENGTTEVKWSNIETTDSAGNKYTFSVQEVDEEGNDFTPENYEKAENGLKVTNTYVSPTDASAKAKKEWVNGPDEKPTVWFELYRQVNDGDLEVVPEAEIKELPTGITEVVWSGLTKTDGAGNVYTFSVKEVDEEGSDFTPDNYEKTENGLEITNTYEIPTTKVTATKEWISGPEERPTVWFKLYRQIDDEEKEQVPETDIETLENGTTEVEWSNIETTDSAGNEYTFSVQEVDEEGNDFTPENYEKAENGLKVTNTYVSPTDASAKAEKNGLMDQLIDQLCGLSYIDK